jgi:hypothetical protein
MRIPFEFQIAGLTVKVVAENGSIVEASYIGKSDFSYQKIQMDLETVPRQTTEQAFCHEIVHWILYVMNEHELRCNEKFVDTFAHLMYQVFSSGGMFKERENGEAQSGDLETAVGAKPCRCKGRNDKGS